MNDKLAAWLGKEAGQLTRRTTSRSRTFKVKGGDSRPAQEALRGAGPGSQQAATRYGRKPYGGMERDSS